MVKLCSIYGCPNSSTKAKIPGVLVHCFPKKVDVHNRWMKAVTPVVKKNINLQNYGVCGSHFTPSDYDETRTLFWYAAPSVFQGPQPGERQAACPAFENKENGPRPPSQLNPFVSKRRPPLQLNPSLSKPPPPLQLNPSLSKPPPLQLNPTVSKTPPQLQLNPSLSKLPPPLKLNPSLPKPPPPLQLNPSLSKPPPPLQLNPSLSKPPPPLQLNPSLSKPPPPLQLNPTLSKTPPQLQLNPSIPKPPPLPQTTQTFPKPSALLQANVSKVPPPLPPISSTMKPPPLLEINPKSLHISRENDPIPVFRNDEQIGPCNNDYDSLYAEHRANTEFWKSQFDALKAENTNLRHQLSSSNFKLKRKATTIAELKQELEEIKRSRSDCSLNSCAMYTSARKIFSEGQCKMMMMGKSRRKSWTLGEISTALSIYSLSPKTYRYLRGNKLHPYPYPSPATLRRAISGLRFPPGKIIEPIMELLSRKFANSTALERTAVLGFDEVEISDEYQYDEGNDAIYGGKSKMLLVCIRGLFKKWKQIVYFDFSGEFGKNQILETIKQLEAVGVSIVAMVNDLDIKNRTTWKDLGIDLNNLETTSFPNPVTQKPVFIFADYPHLLKLLRSHLIDEYYTLDDANKTKITKEHLEEILKHDSHELKINHNLTLKHLISENKQRMRVRPAFQVFSSKVAKTLRFLSIGTPEVAEFYQLINDYSDIMNSSLAEENASSIFKTPYGKHLKEQNEVIDKTIKVFETMTVGPPLKSGKKKAMKPFQKGFIINGKSLKGLYTMLSQSPVNCKYIMTRNLTQDYIELHFSMFRAIGQFDTKPNAVAAIARVQKLTLSFNTTPSQKTNCESKDLPNEVGLDMLEELLAIAHQHRKDKARIEEEIGGGGNEGEEDDNDEEEDGGDDDDDEEDIEFNLYDYVDSNVPDWTDEEVSVSRSYSNLSNKYKCLNGGREFVAGFLAKKMSSSFEMLTSADVNETSWLSYLSKNLTCPSDKWYSKFLDFEQHFEEFLSDSGKLVENVYINFRPKIVQMLVVHLSALHPQVPMKIINYYAKTRITMRVKFINSKVREKKLKGQLRRYNEKHHQPEVAAETCRRIEEEDWKSRFGTDVQYQEAISSERGSDDVYANTSVVAFISVEEALKSQKSFNF